VVVVAAVNSLLSLIDSPFEEEDDKKDEECNRMVLEGEAFVLVPGGIPVDWISHMTMPHSFIAFSLPERAGEQRRRRRKKRWW